MTLVFGLSCANSTWDGAQKQEKANTVFGNMICLITITTVPATLLGYFFPEQALQLFGAEGKLYSFAKDYFMIVFS